MSKLQTPAFQPLSIHAIKPEGWLKNQLRIQADGLGGHLHEFWPDIKDSAWIGGHAEGWERVPYWLDGLIPLAWQLDDAKLKAVCTRYVEAIMARQQPDGWIGPRPENMAHQDMWSLQLMSKVLLQFHDVTGREDVRQVLTKNLRCMLDWSNQYSLHGWGKSRWFETLIAIFFVYDRTGEPWLLELAQKLRDQGEPWDKLAENWPHRARVAEGESTLMTTHIVNNAMAVKMSALCWRLSGDEKDRALVYRLMGAQDAYHGRIIGVPTGDEHFAGHRPIQGTELCSVVEYMFSLETMISLMGDAAFADRLERLAFNALPATFLPDMWAHQYDQQVNQIECSSQAGRPWATNGPESNIFGLQPNFGCCTANMHQGWPKFAAHLWMTSADGGLAAVALAPSTVELPLAGADVKVELTTDYPFRSTLKFKITTNKPARFPLHIRVPGWAIDPRITISNETIRPNAGGFCRLEREWSGTTEIEMTLPMQPQLVNMPEGAAVFLRGPLIYSLPIGERRVQVNTDKPHREAPHADWELYPTTPWNYGVRERDMNIPGLAIEERPMNDCPFSPEGAPIRLNARLRKIGGWRPLNGSCGPVPENPGIKCGEKEDVLLIPYGCTNLRMTELPVLLDNR